MGLAPSSNTNISKFQFRWSQKRRAIDLPALSMQQISTVSAFLYERATTMLPSVQHVRGRLNMVAFFKKHIYRDKSSKLFLYISSEKSISQGVNCRI